jgi:hypothetical protein
MAQRGGKPNPTVDKLISSKELKCTFNTPALNFSTLHLDDYSFLHYTARLYENSNNYSYYIFELHDGRKIDKSFYPAIYGIAADDDWTDEKNWLIPVVI